MFERMDYFRLLELLLLAKVFSRESESQVCVSMASVLLLAFFSLSFCSFFTALLFFVMFMPLVIVVFLEELAST